jgi:REP element-mobilizing transposase RayT
MKFDPCRLTIKQRMCVEEAIRELASRYRWTIHALAVQSDHPHVVITAPRAGDQLREALKAVATRALNKRFGQRRWWAEGGSRKYIWDDEYLARAIRYDLDQRDF